MVAPANGHPHNGHSPAAPSDKRAEANRLNAQKSTGPRTAEGKARSSLNAVKHGLAAQTALLPGEDPAELEALAESLAAQFRPLGALEAILLKRIVSIAWKLQRVAAAEEAAARQMDDEAMRSWRKGRGLSRQMIGTNRLAGARPVERDAGELLAGCFGAADSGKSKPTSDGPLARITHYELKLDAALRASLRELRALRKDGLFSTPPADEPAEDSAPACNPAPPDDAPDGAPDHPAPHEPPSPSTADPRTQRQPAAAEAINSPRAEATNAPRQDEPIPPPPGAQAAPSGGAGPEPPDLQ